MRTGLLQSTPNIEVLVAHSEAPQDEGVVNFFCDILRCFGFGVRRFSGPQLENPGEKLTQALEECPVYAVIITKRQPSGAVSPGSPRSWVAWTGLVARRESRIIIVIKEAGQSDIGAYRQLPDEPLEFARDNLPAAVGPAIARMEEAERQLDEAPLRYSTLRLPDLTHTVTSVEKIVRILPDGYGIVEFVYKLLVTGRECQFVQHRFGLNEYSTSGEKVPTLKELLKTPHQERDRKPTFAYRLLDPRGRGLRISPEEVPDVSTDRLRVFRFHFEPPVPLGRAVTYSWAWSFPGLFRPHGEDSSDFVCQHQFFDLNLAVRFDHPSDEGSWEFEVEPELHVFDPLNRPVARILTTARDSVFWREYSWIQLASSAGFRYRIRWGTR